MATVLRGNDNFDSASPVSTTFGDVGTYVCAMYKPGYSVNFKGSTTAGSNLLYHNVDYGSAGVVGYPFDATESTSHSAGLSGTWRCMGNLRTGTSAAYNINTAIGSIWLRIS